jgi:hypothetical protein
MKSKKASKKTVTKCMCREPKAHRDCMYCGSGVAIPTGGVCGVCHENGIDGPVILGTGRVVCKLHKKAPTGHGRCAKTTSVKTSQLSNVKFREELGKALRILDEASSSCKFPKALPYSLKNEIMNLTDELYQIFLMTSRADY